jgi:ferrous iron transport protein B
MNSTIALAGNPNCGKTTLFNTLTGARQHVGNYPGVTVEKKEGTCTHGEREVRIIDLPGTYSLTAYSMEEVVTRDFLVNEKPGAVVNIVDASNLERNLYLTIQLLELGVPVVVALNMMDVAQTRGMSIDDKKLSELLGVPVIPTVARTGKGTSDIISTALAKAADTAPSPPLRVRYSDDIDQAITEISALVEKDGLLTDTYPARWVALKYLENDEQIVSLGQKKSPELSKRIEAIVDQLTEHLEDTLRTYPEALIADHRYGYIKSILKQGTLTFLRERDRLYISDRIDRVVTHRFLGPLIMAAVIFVLYHFTFTYSQLPVAWLEIFFGWIGNLVNVLLPDGLVKSMLISGVIDGVGGVLGFVPMIMFMFFGIALLEDSGYLARVAFMLDRVFRVFGLHGSSVMPFIISGGIMGGCAVPGVMASRTLRSPKERLATLLTVPFMNCGAKLPVFALLVGAFFSEHEAAFMFLITVIAWSGALLVAKLLRTTVIKGKSTPFVMELPPYRLPTFRGLVIHTWERTWQYIKKAGTVILAISILLWAMMTFPSLPEEQRQDFGLQRTALINQPFTASGELTELNSREAEAALRYSIAGKIGTSLESISQWAGFDWRTNISLAGGFAAKEIIVATMGTAYSLGEVDSEETAPLSQKLAEAPNWRPLTALSLILFVMFYSPCFVSVVCIARESGSWKWAAFSIVFNTLLAFAIAVAVFQIGSMMGF